MSAKSEGESSGTEDTAVGQGGRRERDGSPERMESACALDTQTRQAALKAKIREMNEACLRETLQSAVGRFPFQLGSLLESPEALHGTSDPPRPSWCECGNCREMPTQEESLCCKQQKCLSQSADFEIVVLHKTVLSVARLSTKKPFLTSKGTDPSMQLRRLAYHQFTVWQHGSLGAQERRPIPSCCMWAVRNRYPSPDGKYTGFQPTHKP